MLPLPRGIGFAFETELLGVILAIEIAYGRGWCSLWLEADSTYVVVLLRDHELTVPWRFAARWGNGLELFRGMDFWVSHIFQERNVVVDILTKSGMPESFWDH